MKIKKILSLVLALVFLSVFVAPLSVSAKIDPGIVSATTTDKNTIVINMDSALTAGSHASANGFTVGGTLANAPVAVSNVSVLDTAVTLTLDKDLVYGDTIMVSYDSTSAVVPLAGAGGERVSFYDESVTNALPPKR